MQPGNFGPGQDPYGQPQYGQQPPYQDPYAAQQPYSDPFAQPTQPGDPYAAQQPYSDPFAQPTQPGDPYAQPTQPGDPYAQPTSAAPYPPQSPPYQAPYGQPTTGAPYPPQQPGQYPPAPGYGGFAVPGYGIQPKQSTQALLSMIFGIIGIPLSLCCGIPGAVVGGGFGVAAVVLGVVGLRKSNENPPSGGKNMAIAGLICGGVACVIMIILLVLGVALSLFEFDTTYY